MLPAEALNHLGVSRVIWIDDVFAQKAPELAELLFNSYAIAVECDFPDLKDVLAKAEFSGPELIEEITEVLARLGEKNCEEIKAKFFSHEAIKAQFATPEVSREDIEDVCKALRIDTNDKWTFSQADGRMEDIVKAGDGSVAFIIDLNEAGGAEARGLEILKRLHNAGSKATAFILTHAAKADTESVKEEELRNVVAGESQFLLMPICVIAKGRLEDAKDEKALNQELVVSIKRASLRKTMSHVIAAAGPIVTNALRDTSAELLSIPPDQLDEYVYERGYVEGVSELHVVERIVSSQISQKLQSYFASDVAQEGAARLRKLRDIKIPRFKGDADRRLVQFRLDEVWEPGELVNITYSPIACGDVFVVDKHEKDVKNVSQMFVLLAQPCDIALRPRDKYRAKETAVLAPLVSCSVEEANSKVGVLPCDLEGQKWRCDFDRATFVSVPILDLASFRRDGRVRLDEGHERPSDLIQSQDRIYAARVKIPDAVIAGNVVSDKQGLTNHPAMQLTFGFDYEFSHFYAGRLKDAKVANGPAKIPQLPKRVTWRLQRWGRVRAPYSVALLEDYLHDMGRRAFDRDFTTPPEKGVNGPGGGLVAAKVAPVPAEGVPVAKDEQEPE